MLLELAGGRARLRQDRSLFHKETERFESVLEPLPGWLADMYNLTPDIRLDIALHWATRLQLTGETKDGDRAWLELSEPGRRWLGRQIEEQYAIIYESLRRLGTARRLVPLLEPRLRRWLVSRRPADVGCQEERTAQLW